MNLTPFACHLGITYKCNLLCDHCYADEYKNTADFSYEQICALIDDLYDNGVIQIIYSHGENMLHKDFWRVTEYMRDRGFYVTLMTNGTLVRDVSVAQLLYDAGVRQVFISFDSLDAERHDRRRGVPGSFDRALNALKCFAQVEGMKFGMATSLDGYNWNELDKFVVFGQEHGVHDISFLTIRPNNEPDPNFNLTEYRQVIDKLVQYKVQLKGQINIITHDPLIPMLGDLSALTPAQREDITMGNTCEAGRSFFSIAPDGAVRSCNLVELVVGNIRESSVAEIFEKFRPEVYDTGHPDECTGCAHSSWCRGGCKAFAILEQIHRDENFFVIDQRCLENELKVLA